jgi:hypothetical protein
VVRGVVGHGTEHADAKQLSLTYQPAAERGRLRILHSGNAYWCCLTPIACIQVGPWVAIHSCFLKPAE